MDFGWYGDQDVAAAVDFLASRPEVTGGRIGVVGISTGGEEAIGAMAADPRIRAVVADGATNRTAADKAWLPTVYGVAVPDEDAAARYIQAGSPDTVASSTFPAPRTPAGWPPTPPLWQTRVTTFLTSNKSQRTHKPGSFTEPEPEHDGCHVSLGRLPRSPPSSSGTSPPGSYAQANHIPVLRFTRMTARST